MLYNIPIEPLEERYSAQWITWFEKEFKENNIPFVTVFGQPLTDKITTGSFLDVCGTNYYKASQLQHLCEMLFNGTIKNGDDLFFHDLWFPGIEMLAYIRDGMGIDFSISGCLHAGSYDPYDFLSKKGMTFWAKGLEESWFRIFDLIFVATDFHKRLLLETRKIDGRKVIVTGFPIHYDPPSERIEKENIVVFPHRLDSEKNPHYFDYMVHSIKEKYPQNDWQFIKTKTCCNNKSEYYKLLHRAKIAVSFADQETWGIAQQEALFAGCFPVVPNRLSYAEMYPPMFQYDSFNDACYLVAMLMYHANTYHHITMGITAGTLLRKGESAIWNMLEALGY